MKMGKLKDITLFCGTIHAKICFNGIRYVEDHCDCINGWVVVLSLGLSAQFWYLDDGHHEDEPEKIITEKQTSEPKRIVFTVQSGDAVVFNGSAALNIRHGVEFVIKDSFPDHLKKSLQEKFNGKEEALQFVDKRIICQLHQLVTGTKMLGVPPSEPEKKLEIQQ